MCGIAFCCSKNLKSKEIVEDLIYSIQHRGPDNKNHVTFNDLSLGSCRLSIFDLSSNGNMPMTDKTGRYVIVYNGELYNFKELKKQFNLNTQTNTDTEILLELYIKKKEHCLDYFNGIFSFVIYDKKENTIFCARDHLGVKPFYYIKNQNEFIVSSEIKGLAEIHKLNFNLSEIKSYLMTSFYDYGEDTFYDGIKQLKPGHFIKYSINKKEFIIKKYWDLKKSQKLSLKDNEEDLIEDAFKLFKDSFKAQMNADVKIGLNLSSGIDSQMMMYFVNEINNGQKDISANSFFFDEKNFNEKPELEKIANSINWKVNFFKISSSDIIDNFDETLKFHEGPFPGIPTIAKSLLIKKAYNNDHKVVLEAQGGDDIAGGYRYIFGGFIFDLLKKKDFKKVLSEISHFKKNENENIFYTLNFIYKSFKSIKSGGISADGSININKEIFENSFFKIPDKKSEIFDEISNIEFNLDKIIYRDIFYTKLQRILKSCDRASMCHGKELRVPILDKNIVEFFYNLDSRLKIKNGNFRYFYRALFQNKFNSNGFKKKMYVSDPQIKWLKGDLFDWAYSIISDNKTFHDGIYNTKKLLKYFENFRKNNKFKNSNLFWQSICIKKMLKNSTIDKYI